MKWYKTEPRMSREYIDDWGGYLDVVQNWMLAHWRKALETK